MQEKDVQIAHLTTKVIALETENDKLKVKIVEMQKQI